MRPSARRRSPRTIPTHGMNSSVVPGVLAHDAAQREDLVLARVARRHHVARGVVVGARPPRREAHAARGEARVEQRAASRRCRRPSPSPFVARSPITTRRIVEWPTMKPALSASVPSILSRYSPKLAPVPRHAFLQRADRHALDARQHVQQVVGVLGLERRDREAAVAADHGRDAVQRRRRERGVPEHLRVVVRVDVDEAGRDHLAVGVDRARRLVVDVADRGDAPVGDAEVGAPARARPCRRRPCRCG